LKICNSEREESSREAVKTWFETVRNYARDTATFTSTLLSILPSDAFAGVHLAQGGTEWVQQVAFHTSDVVGS